jgi:hypothetical protein
MIVLVEPSLRRFVSRRTILLVDLRLHVEVDTGDDQVGDDVEGAHGVQHVRVIEGYLLGDLHEPPVLRLVAATVGSRGRCGIQDNDQVGSVLLISSRNGEKAG